MLLDVVKPKDRQLELGENFSFNCVCNPHAEKIRSNFPSFCKIYFQ